MNQIIESNLINYGDLSADFETEIVDVFLKLKRNKRYKLASIIINYFDVTTNTGTPPNGNIDLFGTTDNNTFHKIETFVIDQNDNSEDAILYEFSSNINSIKFKYNKGNISQGLLNINLLYLEY